MIISCDICLNDHYSDDILQNNETDNDFMSSLHYLFTNFGVKAISTFPIHNFLPMKLEGSVLSLMWK